MPDDPEVLIAGAGPVGLALGLELQRFGIGFRIVEKKATRSTTSKALGLQPRLSEVFTIQGIADEFFARGFSRLRSFNLHTSSGKLLTINIRPPQNVAGREACQPRMLIIPQSVTEEILETALVRRGNEVERRRELTGFTQSAEGVLATVRGEDGAEEPIRSQFLVSCEGAHSLVRKQAGFSFAGATLPMRFLLADVTIDWDLPDDGVQAWFHPSGSLAALPFGGKVWRLIVECEEGPAEVRDEITLEQVEQFLVERTTRENARLSDPLWLSDFRINARMVDRFRDGRVFVAGDAAHIHSPAGGQGIATGIQDATNLAWKLAAVLRAGAPDSLLDTFDEERKPIARKVLRSTTAVSQVVFAMNPVMRFIREQLLFPFLGTEFVQRRLFARLSQLEMNYRRGSLSAHIDRPFSRVRVRAGDRAPDIVFSKEGDKVSLFQLLGGGGMLALLGLGENNSEIVRALGALQIRPFILLPKDDKILPAQFLQDIHGDFAPLYGADGAFLYLIRPDGHVALFQRRAEGLELARYLKKIRSREKVEKAFVL